MLLTSDIFLHFHGNFAVWQKAEGTLVLEKIIFPFVFLFVKGGRY